MARQPPVLSSASPRSDEQERLVQEVKKLIAFAERTGATAKGDELILPKRGGYDGELLKYYYDGYVFYAIPPRHYGDDNVSDRDKPGRFGIVRNTLYLYNIISLSTMGAANPMTLTADRDHNYNTSSRISMGLNLSDMSVIETDLEF